MAKEKKDPSDFVWPEDLFMEAYYLKASRDPAKEKARKIRNARCGHIKRKLLRNEPLKGELLKLALDILGDPVEGKDKESMFRKNIATKLKHGMPLEEYECHCVVDMWLLHVRLAP